MAYENLCMYCFQELNGETVCPHCGGDSSAAVPQIQMLPGTLVYHDRFLLGRALGQDSSGIVYNALDTKRGGVIRIREYLPRNCAERLNDGGVVPVAGMEDAFETGMRKLRASVESVEDPHKRHFYFEENGTAYIAQRKGGSAPAVEHENPDDGGGNRQIVLYIAIAAAVVLAVAIGVILFLNSMGSTDDRTMISPLSSTSPGATWLPNATPSPTPHATATFAALVDPELSWMDYTYSGDVNSEFQQQQQQSSATQKPTVQGNQSYPTINDNSSDQSVRELQQYLVRLGWLSSSAVSGRYDSTTREAVRAFQHYVNEYCSPAEKLAEDGIAGKKTQQWLYNSSVSLTRPTATPRPKVTAAPDSNTVDRNSSASAVRDLQNKLIALGLMPAGSADGKYGSATQTAVKNFQRRVNELQGYTVLETSGSADALTRSWLNYYVEEWRRLQSATALPSTTNTPAIRPSATPKPSDSTVDASSSREEVREVQQLLQQVGLLTASDADGVYGTRTADAVRKFQSWINQLRGEETLDITGAVDSLTMRYLEYCVENGRMYDLPADAPATDVPSTEVPATEAPATEAPGFEPDATVAPEEPEVTEVPPEQQAGGQGITPDSPRESIEFMQEILSEVGLLGANQVDGAYGPATAEALRQFQQYVNDMMGEGTLDVSGQCDTDTLRYLQEAYDQGWNLVDQGDAPEATEEPGGSVEFVQEMLSTIGLLGANQVDGDYGAATQEAVRAFQQYVNDMMGEGTLDVSGQCDADTLRYLREAYDEGWNLVDQGDVPDEPKTEPTEAPQASTVAAPQFAVSGQAAEGRVELAPGSYQISWSAEGDVQSYYVYLYDGSGNLMQSAENRDMTGFDMNTSSMVPGEVYELRVGALPVNGTQDDIVWQSIQLTLAVVEEPTEAPTPEPTEAPQAGTVAAPRFTVSGQEAGGFVELEPGSYQIGWSAEGDVQGYYVYLYDSNGNLMQSAENADLTGFDMNTSSMTPGEVYELRVGALPVNGTQDDIVWQSLQLMLPIVETPVPTEAPTPAPSVSAPVISIGSSVYQTDGVQYINDDTAIFSWMADGPVESYTVNLSYEDGTSYSLGTTTDTSKTVKTSQLQPGLYRLYVGATPVGGSEDNTVWSELVFGVPAPAATQAPEPEQPQEPEQQERPHISYVDANSGTEDILAVQMALYRYGLLNTDLAQEGVLDQGTLEAVATFQQRANDVLDAGLTVIDPSVDAYIDGPTLELLLYQNPNLSA